MSSKNSKISNYTEPILYSCEKCDYITARKYNLNIHYNSKKHMITQELHKISKISNEQNDYIRIYKCKCGKVYKYRQGLYTHRKKCNYEEDINKETTQLEKLEYENEILKHQILELTKDTQLMK
jgi:hypothetical protein